MINDLSKIIVEAIKTSGYGEVVIDVSPPKSDLHGDYSTSIALSLAKTLGRSPLVIAENIKKHIKKGDLVKAINVVPPGFINFFIQEDALISAISENATKTDNQTKSKVMVEYTDPNPFKEFHIGHLYSNTVGESLARLLEAQGAEVRRVCYQGDVGIHVACSVWGMTKEVPSSKFQVLSEKAEDKLIEFEDKDSVTRVAWLGACYAYGATAYKEDEQAKKEIQTLNAQVFLAAQDMHKRISSGFVPVIDYHRLFETEIIPQSTLNKLYETGRKWTLEYFEEIYKKLGTKFEDYYFESEVGEYGYALAKAHISDGIFEESNGAIVFPGEKYGLHTRVFVNSLGLPTYEAKELGLNPKKFRDFAFDKSIIVTANEIDEYFKVLLKAMSLVAPEVASRTKHISHGVVRLPEGKMSSRTGKIISGEWLINEAKSKLSKIVEENSRIEESLKNETLDKLAIASIKYALLRSNIGKDVVFDFEESLSFEGNSGPYLLYTIVRCKSILEKSNTNLQPTPGIYPEQSRRTLHPDSTSLSPDDISLLRLLAKYNETVVAASNKLAPHIICTYLHTLAKEFSSYYEKVNILKSEGELKEFRLFLVSKVRETLSNGIHMLGFEEVEKM